MDRGAWSATVHVVVESDATEHTHTKKPAAKDHFLKIISFICNVKIGQSYIDIVVY